MPEFASLNRPVGVLLALLVALLCQRSASAQESWRPAVDKLGAAIAEEIERDPPDQNLKIFEYTDAKLGRYWYPSQDKVIGSLDLFFYAQANGSKNAWGVPLGSAKVESIHVLRLIPVRRDGSGAIKWEVHGETFGAYDDRSGAAEKDGFTMANAARREWLKTIEAKADAIADAASAALGTHPMPVPMPPPSCDDYVFSLFERLEGEFGESEFPNSRRRGIHGPLAKVDLTGGETPWAVLILFAEDRAIHCFRHLSGQDGFPGDVKDWFRGAMRVPGEWVVAIYLPHPNNGTPKEIQDLAGFRANDQKPWNDKICDFILLPGDAYDGSPAYFYETGARDAQWAGGDLSKHPANWRALKFNQGYHTVRAELVFRGFEVGADGAKNTRVRMPNNAVSSIWLNWPPK